MNTKTKVIIIEGPDNCGKSCLINKLKEYYNDNVVIFHAMAPKTDNLFNYYYNGFIHDTLNEYYKYSVDAIIHDRSMYGEYIYGSKYRNENKEDIINVLCKLETGQLKSFIKEDELYFILLTSDNVDLLVKNDDGLSISNKRTDIEDEINLFNEIFDLSTIKNKTKIYVNNNSDFRVKDDIFNEAITFIET